MLATLFAGMAISNHITLKMIRNAERIKSTRAVIGKLVDLRSALETDHNQVRGFIITGNRSFLRLHEDSAETELGNIRDLRAMLSGDISLETHWTSWSERFWHAMPSGNRNWSGGNSPALRRRPKWSPQGKGFS